ncbi:MAG TPA: SDR family oxidoreductase [Ignavibacteriaceae bacterium]|jgi:short-subunit dehydrogenase|nr:SDR family oxidoreductase [Ignavibacteriaceae bacterium]HOJ17591.1 SDR family oxidoreductase [Ignavibacteriaceae bacterium]
MNQKKIVWITGASSGIGRACAVEFVKNGFNVWASARRSEELEKLRSEIESQGLRLNTAQLDIRNPEDVKSVVENIVQKDKRIDCLINSAGISSFKTAMSDSLETITNIIDTNLYGAIYAMKSVLGSMREQGGGTIINILSIVNRKIFTNSSAYAASKMGLQGYTESLREEVRKDKIRIVNIYPGATVTDIWATSVREKFHDRMMKTEEVAKAILWSYKDEGQMVVEDIVLRPELGDLS